MESLKNISEKSHNLNSLSDERGQTFVEFVLLLSMIMLISFSFMKLLNTGIGKYWTAMANTLLIDVPTAKKLELR